MGEAPSYGLKRGVVVDRQAAADSVAEAMEACGLRGGRVTVGIAGSHISSFNTEVTLLNRSRNLTVTDRFVRKLDQEARQLQLDEDERVIHVIPRGYVLDGSEGVKNPVGLAARKVTMRAHVISGAVSSIQNLLRAVEDCGVRVSRIVLEPLASSEACLLDVDRESGVVLIDMGGGTTDIATFFRGALTHTAVKLDDRHYNASFISQILECRAREMLDYVRDSLDQTGMRELVPGGAVLTGGGSLLDGMTGLAEEVLGMRARTASPRKVKGEVKRVQKPQY